MAAESVISGMIDELINLATGEEGLLFVKFNSQMLILRDSIQAEYLQ